MTFNIRRIATADLPEWLRMRQALWSELSKQDLLPEMEVILTNPRYAVFIAARNNGGAAGFVEVNLREYAEGCETSPVGYIEGWYVDEDVRRQGLGMDLISVAEQWAREKGCVEIASDTWLENEASIHGHLKMGYYEVERLVHFVKNL